MRNSMWVVGGGDWRGLITAIWEAWVGRCWSGQFSELVPFFVCLVEGEGGYFRC